MLTCCFWLLPDEKRHLTVPKSLIMCILIYSFELAWRACFNRLPWKSPSTDSFDKVNHVQGHSGFSVLPVSQSVFQCSGAVLIEVKGPTNVESIWNGKKPGCLPWTQKDFYEFQCKIHRKVWSANFLLILSSCQMCRVWDILNILLKNLEFNLPQSKIMKQQETHTSSNETFFWMIVIIGRKEGGRDS